MSTKLIRLVAALIVIASIAGNSGVVRADRNGPPSFSALNIEAPLAPQSLQTQALTIPPASSLGVQFIHIATASNIYASYTTIIDHPLTNGNPNAIILVTPNDNPGNVGGTNDPHPIGVIYSSGKWAIFNQDLAAIPVGAAFNVIIPTAGAGVFVQKTTVAGTATDIDSVLTDGHPNAIILVTPNYNPGGACPCVPANFHLGVEYHGTKWAIFTQDSSLMPLNAAFNLFVLPARAGVFVHKATVGNTANIYSTSIDNALTNGNPNALVFVTQNWNPGGLISGTNDDHPIGVFYNGSKWEIYNQDLVALQVDASFNVLVLVPSSAIFVHTAAGNLVSDDFTKLDNALTNNHPNALVFTTPNLTPGGVISGAYANHNIGVFYSSTASQWEIFNQDALPMLNGTAFNVLVPNPDTSVFVHTATAANILSHSTIIDHPLTNGKPDAIIIVTQNVNPGGVYGVPDDHPIGVFYDGSNWRIFNQDNAAMPVGTAFNVLVPKAGVGVFVHKNNSSYGDSTFIDNSLTNGNPNAIVFVTPNYNPGGIGGMNDNHPIGVKYTGSQRWWIFNQDGAAMPLDAAFNVYVFSSSSITFNSVGVNDGWILESSETSGLGGTLNSTTQTFNLGDDAAKKQYRGMLSFNTGAGLPDNAVITKVTLKIKKSAVTGGGNPVTLFQGFMVDIKKGTFGTSALQTSDFQTAASKTYGPFNTALSSGWYSIDLTAGNAYINKLSTLSGLTQIRLRFKLDDNNNLVANYLSLFSGNAPAASRPQLVIEYYVP